MHQSTCNMFTRTSQMHNKFVQTWLTHFTECTHCTLHLYYTIINYSLTVALSLGLTIDWSLPGENDHDKLEFGSFLFELSKQRFNIL